MGNETLKQEASLEEKCPRCGSDYKPTKKLVQMYTNEGYVKYCDHDWHKGSATAQKSEPTLCEGCPPIGYPTDKTRCTPCPRRSAPPVETPTKYPADGDWDFPPEPKPVEAPTNELADWVDRMADVESSKGHYYTAKLLQEVIAHRIRKGDWK